MLPVCLYFGSAEVVICSHAYFDSGSGRSRFLAYPSTACPFSIPQPMCIFLSVVSFGATPHLTGRMFYLSALDWCGVRLCEACLSPSDQTSSLSVMCTDQSTVAGMLIDCGQLDCSQVVCAGRGVASSWCAVLQGWCVQSWI